MSTAFSEIEGRIDKPGKISRFQDTTAFVSSDQSKEIQTLQIVSFEEFSELIIKMVYSSLAGGPKCLAITSLPNPPLPTSAAMVSTGPNVPYFRANHSKIEARVVSFQDLQVT
jgi:hypothetical protein